MSDSYVRRVVALLAGQAFAFGLSESLLLISANAIFLHAYGSKWLPLTYVGIAAVGTVLAAAVARTLRRRPLPAVSLAAETAVAVVFLAAWVVLSVSGGVWVSAPLLVLFPVLLQIGFIFVGGQAGRLLGLQEIKARFPRIVSGFAAGFLVGGIVGARLLSVLGATEHLLLVAVGAQVAFVALLAVTAGRFHDRLGHVERSPLAMPRAPLRRLLANRFVLLVVAYQVLSAAGTQLVEYLVFDRAAARYHHASSLADFLSKYTVALNAIDMLFLALLAGMLLRRFGLRLGIAANPVLVTGLVVAMLVSVGVSGAASLSLFVLVATARIVDISLTDGTTRTSINSAYQVLPADERLTVQSTVEGAGVPLAIGSVGALLFALRVLDVSVAAIVGITAAVCVVWTVAGVFLYREYAHSIAAALRRRLLPDAMPDLGDDDVRRLLASDEGGDVRLGLELLAGAPSEVELERLAGDPRTEVRVPALSALAASGDGEAAARLGSEVAALAASPAAAERLLAAEALASAADRTALASLVRDPDPGVRAAALAAVSPGDASLVEDAVAALDDPPTIGPAVAAVGRLGDAVLPALARVLRDAPGPSALRLVRAVRPTSADALVPYAEHPDRELGLAVLTALGAAKADASELSALLDRTLQADAEHAARCLAALAAVEPAPVLERALRDELDLLRRRVLAVLAIRHGADVIREVTLGLSAEGDRRNLALELLEVALGQVETARALPLVRADVPDEERLRLLAAVAPVPDLDRDGVLAAIAADEAGEWRSSWLQACAAYEAEATLVT